MNRRSFLNLLLGAAATPIIKPPKKFWFFNWTPPVEPKAYGWYPFTLTIAQVAELYPSRNLPKISEILSSSVLSSLPWIPADPIIGFIPDGEVR